MPVADPARRAAWLFDLGYTLAYREDGFIEVLVSRQDERWLGRGEDRDAALRDAVRHMFPSHAAQELLSRIERGDEATADEPTTTRHEDDHEDDSLPVGAPGITVTNEDVVDGEELAAETAALPEPAPVERRIVLPERAPDDAVAEVAGILREVVDAEAEIAMMSPRLVQLNMLAWLCRARAQQQAFPADGRVRRLVAGIASALGQFANLYWPGNVPALKAMASPAASLGVLGCTSPPSTWEDVSSKAECLIAEIRDDPDRDEDGWRDGACLRPRPSDPTRVLSVVRERIEAVLGSLDRRHDRTLEDDLQRVDHKRVEELVGLGYQVRWLRRGVPDDIDWGRIMGRLRWAAQKLGPRGTALARVIDPDTRSASRLGWAEQLAAGHRERERERRRSEAMRRPPWLVGPCSQDAPHRLARGGA